jgi:hypothetical protein
MEYLVGRLSGIASTVLEKLSMESSDFSPTRGHQINPVSPPDGPRRNSRRATFSAGTEDWIRQKLINEQVSSERTCAGCGIETDNTLQCILECERPYQSGPGFWKRFFAGLFGFLFFWPLLLLLLGKDKTEMLGRESVLELPLRLCHGCQMKLGAKPRPREIAALLRKVPVYDKLLSEYPRASITVR